VVGCADSDMEYNQTLIGFSLGFSLGLRYGRQSDSDSRSVHIHTHTRTDRQTHKEREGERGLTLRGVGWGGQGMQSGKGRDLVRGQRGLRVQGFRV
jgi:hypothetical protein